MIECPNCHTANLDSSKHCGACGADLTAAPQSKTTVRLDNPPVDSQQAGQVPTISLKKPRGGTRPVTRQEGLVPRPQGAVFAGRYVNEALTFTDGQRACYRVGEQGVPSDQQVRQCPNPTCGAIHAKWSGSEGPDQFCNSCGAPMQTGKVELDLCESQENIFGHAPDVVEYGLVHSAIRAPIAFFPEDVGGTVRYCLVTPAVEALPKGIERTQVIEWGANLARALDYIAKNNLSFSGQMDDSLFALAAGHLVWSKFESIISVPDNMLDQAKAGDVKALATQLYKWLTGKTQFSPDPALPPELNELFNKALAGSGFARGRDLATELEKVQSAISAPGSVDYRLGRMTDVGKVRTLNEDSLMTLELSRIQQSNPQPIGVYVVADGMGGHSAGEVASGTIVSYIAQKAAADISASQTLLNKDWETWLKETVNGANKAVFDMRKAAGTDMGSTLVMVLLDGPVAYFAHVGDSRGYIVHDGKLERATTDHSLVQRLVSTGQIQPEEIYTHPQRNVIYRTIGDKAQVEVDTSRRPLQPGDRVMICSDGLWEMVKDEEIQKIIVAHNPQEACKLLIDAANAAGGEDNIAVVIVELV